MSNLLNFRTIKKKVKTFSSVVQLILVQLRHSLFYSIKRDYLVFLRRRLLISQGRGIARILESIKLSTRALKSISFWSNSFARYYFYCGVYRHQHHVLLTCWVGKSERRSELEPTWIPSSSHESQWEWKWEARKSAGALYNAVTLRIRNYQIFSVS